MKFHFDTEKCDDIQFHFDREADLEENILDFCFGITALYTDFCMQLGLDAEDTTSLLKVCHSCMTRNLEEFISNGMLDSEDEDEDDEDDEDDDVSDDELDELTSGLATAGFSEEEISNIVGLVQDAGSMEAALNILKGIAEDAGIDLPDFDDVHIPEDAEDDNLCSKEQMKKEAASRLEQLVSSLGLNPKVISYWNDGCLYYSYLTAGGFMGSIDKIEYDSKNVDIVKKFESEYGSMVYHVIEGNHTLILLSVSNDSDEWVYERLADNRIMAYVHCFHDPNQSEFGDIALSSLHGALVRIG